MTNSAERRRNIGVLLRASLLALACCGSAPAQCAAPAPAVEQPPARLTLAEKRAARTIIGRFRRAGRDLDAQANALSAAMQAGPYATSEIQKLIADQLQPQVERYRTLLAKSASTQALAKFEAADKAEVTTLQQQVNALREDANLTKERIQAEGDPALQRLGELLLVDRADVLANNRPVIEARTRLEGPGALWETSARYLAQFEPPKTDVAESAPSPRDALSFQKYLEQEEEIAVRLALPMDDATRQVLTENERLTGKLDPEEARCVLALNLMRILLGLNPLSIDLQLTATGRDHSHDMRTLNFFAHESPVEGKKTPWDRAKRFGTSASGENIAAGYATGPDANLAWFHSPGHHKNMLGKHTRVGVGRDERHWTQLFGN